MKRILWMVACTGVWTSLAAAAVAGDVVDRIVAVVNGQIILQSDWQDAIRYKALLENRSTWQFSADERKEVLDHTIDQELLRGQMQSSDFQHTTEEEISRRVQEIRAQHPEANTDERWQAILASYGLTEGQLRERAALEINLMRLVDARLRPDVKVDAKSVEDYYQQELLPELRKNGAHEVPLADVGPQIRELLTQQQVNHLLVAWLQTLRDSSQIHRDTSAGNAEGELR